MVLSVLLCSLLFVVSPVTANIGNFGGDGLFDTFGDVDDGEGNTGMMALAAGAAAILLGSVLANAIGGGGGGTTMIMSPGGGAAGSGCPTCPVCSSTACTPTATCPAGYTAGGGSCFKAYAPTTAADFLTLSKLCANDKAMVAEFGSTAEFDAGKAAITALGGTLPVSTYIGYTDAFGASGTATTKPTGITSGVAPTGVTFPDGSTSVDCGTLSATFAGGTVQCSANANAILCEIPLAAACTCP